MLEIFLFKECLGAWVKSCDKFGKMNDDYIDQQTFFVFKLSSYLCSFMVGPRTFWTPLVLNLKRSPVRIRLHISQASCVHCFLYTSTYYLPTVCSWFPPHWLQSSLRRYDSAANTPLPPSSNCRDNPYYLGTYYLLVLLCR